MRKFKTRFCCLLLLLAFVATGWAQKPAFSYKRKIETPREGWFFISLPADFFKRVNPELSDLRIYQITGSDTLEVPYLLEVQNDKVTEETLTPPVLNKSTRDGKLFLTFELKKDQKVNYLDLEFEEENFNGYAAIEGSTDQKSWFELEKRQRILSIHTSDVDFASSTLSFPTTNYRYLRVSIAADKSLTFLSGSFRDRKLESGSFNDIDLKWAAQEDKSSKSTVVTMDLAAEQPVGKFSIDANAGGSDFYRYFVLEALRDSVKSEKGWVYYYDRVWDGYLTSLDYNEFTLSQSAEAKKFKITIQNADSPPLKIKNVRAAGTEVRLIAKFSRGENYLFYGNGTVSYPSYDLVHFKDKIVPDSISLSLGAEEKLIADAVKGSPLFENKLWLWGIMGAIIGLLGFFTVRMMKNK